jgi:hypothetical protein
LLRLFGCAKVESVVIVSEAPTLDAVYENDWRTDSAAIALYLERTCCLILCGLEESSSDHMSW